MATLHVIYDPNDKITHNPKFNSEMKINVAMISLPSFYSQHEMEEAAKDLALMLLRHHYGHLK